MTARYRVGLVCSTGGHLAQLFQLREWWSWHDRFWVTFDRPDARELLAGERVYFGVGPTNRHVGNVLRNFGLAGRILDAEGPDVLVSNGAGIGLSFFARAWGRVPLVFLEVPDRLDLPSLTGRIAHRLADRMVLTNAVQRRLYPDGIVLGSP